eukprot:966233-Amphidinium_carterae.1
MSGMGFLGSVGQCFAIVKLQDLKASLPLADPQKLCSCLLRAQWKWSWRVTGGFVGYLSHLRSSVLGKTMGGPTPSEKPSSCGGGSHILKTLNKAKAQSDGELLIAEAPAASC